MKLKAKAIVTGLSTYIPGYKAFRPTGGTGSARYCYSVWLRHLTLAHTHGRLAAMPKIVAELGPGDSIGIGLAALLSGIDKYYAFDLVKYSNLENNLTIFDELVQLFRKRELIPGEEEFPLVNPKLDSYEFPDQLLSEVNLSAALNTERVAELRLSIERVNGARSRIVYHAPWTDPSVIQKESVDMIYSQAVLEHVDDLSGVYRDMRRWLKPNGVMSHQIDYKCHGKADTWNGHWTYSDFVWKVVVGRRPYLLNRAPHSEHVRLMRNKGFVIVVDKAVHSTSELRRPQLARRFRGLSEDDLTTSGSYILAAAPDQKESELAKVRESASSE